MIVVAPKSIALFSRVGSFRGVFLLFLRSWRIERQFRGARFAIRSRRKRRCDVLFIAVRYPICMRAGFSKNNRFASR